MKRARPWILGGVLLLGAGALTAVTPGDDAVIAPLLLRGAVGDAVQSRSLIATATDATFADEVAVPASDWSSAGNWIVVKVTASAPTTEADAAIQLATLVIGDRVFHSSERVATTLEGAPLRVGTDTDGMLAFELPPDVVAGTAELRLTTSYYTAELDDLIAISLALDDLPRVPTLDIEAPTWSTP